MEHSDIKLGMKVVPHRKTADGRVKGLNSSVVWRGAKVLNQPYLYVVLTKPVGDYPEIMLSEIEGDVHGDYFLASDVSPYREDMKREVTVSWKFNCKCGVHHFDTHLLPFNCDCGRSYTFNSNERVWDCREPQTRRMTAEELAGKWVEIPDKLVVMGVGDYTHVVEGVNPNTDQIKVCGIVFVAELVDKYKDRPTDKAWKSTEVPV
jgi:hypothetical protein